jgi:hypothetical protein
MVRKRILLCGQLHNALRRQTFLAGSLFLQHPCAPQMERNNKKETAVGMGFVSTRLIATIVVAQQP